MIIIKKAYYSEHYQPCMDKANVSSDPKSTTVHVYVTEVATPLPRSVIDKGVCILNEYCKAQIYNKFRPQDATLSLLGKWLWAIHLEQAGYGIDVIQNIVIDEYKRPCIPGTVDCNITHCDGVVMLVVADKGKVGCDVEPIRQINFAEYYSCFQSIEWEYIHSKRDSSQAFFDLWCRKEALIKADGRGLYIPLTDINVLSSPVKVRAGYWYYDINIGTGYSACIATEYPVTEIVYNKTDVDTIIGCFSS